MLAAGRADWYCPLTVVLKSENLLRMRETLKRFIILRGNESYTFFLAGGLEYRCKSASPDFNRLYCAIKQG